MLSSICDHVQVDHDDEQYGFMRTRKLGQATLGNYLNKEPDYWSIVSTYQLDQTPKRSRVIRTTVGQQS